MIGNAEGVQILLPKEDPISFAAVDVVALVVELCDAFGCRVCQTGLGGPLNVGSSRTSSTPSGRGGGVVAGSGRHIGYFSGSSSSPEDGRLLTCSYQLWAAVPFAFFSATCHVAFSWHFALRRRMRLGSPPTGR